MYVCVCLCAISKLLQQGPNAVGASWFSCWHSIMQHSVYVCVCVYVFQAKFIDIHCLFVVDRWPSSLSLSQPTEITIVASFLANTKKIKNCWCCRGLCFALAAHTDVSCGHLQTYIQAYTHTHTSVAMIVCMYVCTCSTYCACNWLLVYNSCFWSPPVGCR